MAQAGNTPLPIAPASSLYLCSALRQRQVLHTMVQHKAVWSRCSKTLFRALTLVLQLLHRRTVADYCADTLRRFALLLGGLCRRLKQHQQQQVCVCLRACVCVCMCLCCVCMIHALSTRVKN